MYAKRDGEWGRDGSERVQNSKAAVPYHFISRDRAAFKATLTMRPKWRGGGYPLLVKLLQCSRVGIELSGGVLGCVQLVVSLRGVEGALVEGRVC